MLIRCWECGKEISDLVEVCPHCGYPLKVEKESGKYELTQEDEEYMDNSDISELKKVGYLLEKKFPKYLALDLAQKYEFKCHPEAEQRYNAVIAREKRQAQQQANIPKCPTCGSTNVEKIGMGKKLFGGAMFGLFSSDVRKTMHCKSCGYKW